MSQQKSAMCNAIAFEIWSLLRDGEGGLWDRCGQCYILEQLAGVFCQILADQEFDQGIWIAEMERAVVALQSDGSLVYQTAQVVIFHITRAPWRIEGGEWLRSVNTIAQSMKMVYQTIRRDLEQAASRGIDLRVYRDPADGTHGLLDHGGICSSALPHHAHETRLPPSKPLSPGDRAASDGEFVRGHARRWTRAEELHLLHAIADNLDKTWDARVQAHNDSYVIPEGVLPRHQRTKDGVRQRLITKMQLTKAGLKERVAQKIAEMEAGADEEDERA